MPDALLATLALIVFGVVGLALLYRRTQPHANDSAISETIHLRGHGSETTRPFRLAAGNYKLTCTLPDDVPAVVTLLDTQTGDGETLLVGRGCGVTGVTISAAGRYAVRVEPASGDAAWALVVTPLGLPSSRLNG